MDGNDLYWAEVVGAVCAAHGHAAAKPHAYAHAYAHTWGDRHHDGYSDCYPDDDRQRDAGSDGYRHGHPWAGDGHANARRAICDS